MSTSLVGGFAVRALIDGREMAVAAFEKAAEAQAAAPDLVRFVGLTGVSVKRISTAEEAAAVLAEIEEFKEQHGCGECGETNPDHECPAHGFPEIRYDRDSDADE